MHALCALGRGVLLRAGAGVQAPPWLLRGGRALESRGYRGRAPFAPAAAASGAQRRSGGEERSRDDAGKRSEPRAPRGSGGDGPRRAASKPPPASQAALAPPPRGGAASPPAGDAAASPRAGVRRVSAPRRPAGGAAASAAAAAPSARPPPRRASATRQAGGPIRLAKALADAGVASRRGAEALVFAGRVRVNGAAVLVPQTPVTPGVDKLEVDGAAVVVAARPADGKGGAGGPRHHYFALHKPAGYLCSNQTEGEKLVLDLFAPWLARWKARWGAGEAKPLPPRLFTVGRLDAATSGLLLVTNDGAWAQRVAHPSGGVTKEYVLTAEVVPTKRQLADMLAGCDVDGAFVAPLRVERVEARDGGPPGRVLVELADGRNREVRRLAEAAGVDVKALKRTRVGGLRLPAALRAGTFSELTFRQARDLLAPAYQEAARAGAGGEEPAGAPADAAADVTAAKPSLLQIKLRTMRT